MHDETENEDSCIKWSIKQYKKYLDKNGIDSKELFEKINKVIIKTVISFESVLMSQVPNSFSSRNNFYEVFGFDILIDKKLKPWLIEVNVCPSMGVSTKLDKRIKTKMITEL